MGYPRFPDEPVDGYHPGEEQPAMHNDEPQTMPASDELIAEILAGLEGVPAGPWQKMSTPGADDEPMFAIMAQPHPAMRGFTHPIAWAGDPLATHITRCSPENIRALIARTAADGAPATRAFWVAELIEEQTPPSPRYWGGSEAGFVYDIDAAMQFVREIDVKRLLKHSRILGRPVEHMMIATPAVEASLRDFTIEQMEEEIEWRRYHATNVDKE